MIPAFGGSSPPGPATFLKGIGFMEKTVAVILAAGEGTRLKSAKAKALHKVAGQSLLAHVVAAVRKAGVKQICVVVGHKKEDVKKEFVNEDVEFVVQKELLGTGDAVKKTVSFLKKQKEADQVLVLCGDAPLIRSESIESMIQSQREQGGAATVLTGVLQDPDSYGRVVRGPERSLIKIVEHKDATEEEKQIQEINSGAYCFEKSALVSGLDKLHQQNAQKEYYLPELIRVFVEEGSRVDAVVTEEVSEVLGVNSRMDLALAEKAFQKRINLFHMENGVTLMDPETIYIDSRVTIEPDTIIYPFTYIEGEVKIKKNCRIGPFTQLRSGTLMEDEAEVGNFTEVKKSKIGKKTKAKHLSYIGDTMIGEKVNIGAGTITANYDGKAKYVTIIEDGAFIGSNCTIVAPVKIGKQAITGAGSVVTKGHDVAENEVVIGVPAKPIKKKVNA